MARMTEEEAFALMVRMTDEEAEYWDDYYTKNTIMPNLSRPGFFARKYGIMVRQRY